MPFLTVHDCPVRYDRTGNGPTVVLLHGGGLDSAQLSWAPLTPHLAPLADVIAPDLPGYGGARSAPRRRQPPDTQAGCAHSLTPPGCAAACSAGCR